MENNCTVADYISIVHFDDGSVLSSIPVHSHDSALGCMTVHSDHALGWMRVHFHHASALSCIMAVLERHVACA